MPAVRGADAALISPRAACRLLAIVQNMNSSRHLAGVGIATFAMVSAFANVPAAGADSDSPQDFLQRNYGLKVTLQSEDSEIGDLRLGSLTNAGQLDDYLRALVEECKKYPATFF